MSLLPEFEFRAKTTQEPKSNTTDLVVWEGFFQFSKVYDTLFDKFLYNKLTNSRWFLLHATEQH